MAKAERFGDGSKGWWLICLHRLSCVWQTMLWHLKLQSYLSKNRDMCSQKLALMLHSPFRKMTPIFLNNWQSFCVPAGKSGLSTI